jgi:glycosyltransferase involved in cell wall biosynthesis
MKSNKGRKYLFIDAIALASERKSGVGVTLEHLLSGLVEQKDLYGWTIYLVVPLWKSKLVKKYTNDKIKIKTLFLPAKVLDLLNRFRVMPPLDWILGGGVYLFPNYRNFPLWSAKSVTYIYDLGFLLWPSTLQPKNLNYLTKYVKRWAWRADKIVTISNQVKEEIEKHLGIPYNKISVVPCGVDSRIFYKRNKNEIERIKSKYGIIFNKYILFVGNIEPRKNLNKLLNAYKKLNIGTQKSLGLVIVGGDGWLNEGFYKLYNNLVKNGHNVIKIREYVENEDLPALYSGATMLIQPALYEGFGLTPLEAMATKTPVALSAISSMEEVVLSSGNYFNPDNISNIAKTINNIYTNSENDLSQKIESGYIRALELSWKNSSNLLMEVIQDQYKLGKIKHPLYFRLRKSYNFINNVIRKLLGERVHNKYEPDSANTTNSLIKIIKSDYRKETPNFLQYYLFIVYIKLKHWTALTLKKSLKIMRSK